jgi:hypothetical protein
LNQIDVSLGPEQRRELEEATRISADFFVFNLIPFDSTLPTLAIFVVFHPNRKANGQAMFICGG